MLDLRLIRQETDRVRTALTRKGGDDEGERLDRVLELDTRRRDLLGELEALKRERNDVSREIGRLRSTGEDPGDRLARMKQVSAAVKSLAPGLSTLEDEIRETMQWLPNLPADSVPDGRGAEDNVVLRVEGEPPPDDFERLDHVTLAERLGILDLKAGSRVAGSGFVVLRGDGGRLVRGLIQWMLDLHTGRHGYTEVWSPALARESCLWGTGQLPKLRDDMYRVADHDAFLIPTAEVTLTGLCGDQTFSESELPLKLVGYTPCFRREAGAAGRETRGLVRVHQFDKVELVRVAHPDRSWTDHEELVNDAEEILKLLGLHYRIIELCAGDLSFAAARCYDIEVWAPGEKRWLEVSSCSNFVDFQARRLAIRMQPAGGGRSRLAHTLNGSGLALPRLLVALLEQYQTPAGGVVIPEILRPFMSGVAELSPATAPAARA